MIALPFTIMLKKVKDLEQKLADLYSKSSSIDSKLSVDANNNLKVVIAADNVGIVKSSDLPKDSNGNLKINVVANDVGLASESTLSSINNKIPSPTANGNLPIAIKEDGVGLVKSSDIPKTSSGNIAIAVQEDGVGLVKSSDLPKDANGNLKINVSASDIVVPIDVQGDAVGLLKTSDIARDSSNRVVVNVGAQDLKPLEIGVHKSTEQKLSNYSLSAGGSVNVDLTIPAGKSAFALTIRASYDANATAGIEFYIYWSPDGSNWDTDTDEVYTDFPFAAGATKQKTYIIHAVTPYVRVVIKNKDANYAVTLNVWVSYI